MQLASGETFTISAGGDISLVGADANPAVIRLIDPPSHAENSSEIRFEREAKPTEYWYVKKVPEEHGTQADWFILAPTDELIASAGSDAKIIMGRHPFESNSAYSFSVLVSNFFEVQIGGSGLIDAADSSNFNVRAKLWVLNSGGIEIDLPSGDPTVVFDTGGTDYFTVGVDDTDKKFKINSGGSLGSTSDFEMDSSGNVGIRNDLIIGGTVDGQDIAAMEARITALEGA